ncbi:hypothetical protein [Pseudovibrio sp. WM33]|uniref:hypothetical protein n=1 Tax=Pseudovibrio sp. WM33 TaxID=1735585 RepID=UPI0007AEC20F|nr:hypothetical protein [Pseudovibrio sp. WM33]KZL23792.1 hypothetical protein PsWM33_03081 [Pseudovibrio sp. WM33]
MSQLDQTVMVFEHRAEVPTQAALGIWQAWCALSGWPQWDASLRGIEATENGLALGKRFCVVPKASPAPIPVNVTAFEEGRHFTTSSVSPLGLLSFGHSVATDPTTGKTNLAHSICAVPSQDTPFPEQVWNRLKSDVVESVSALALTAQLAMQDDRVMA